MQSRFSGFLAYTMETIEKSVNPFPVRHETRLGLGLTRSSQPFTSRLWVSYVRSVKWPNLDRLHK